MKKSVFGMTCAISLLALLSGCEQLQDSLHDEQMKDQEEGIGALSAETSTYYFNGTEDEDIFSKGEENHLVLDLSQIANADNAGVKYTLAYTMDGVEYTSSGSGKGTLSDSKSKFYVDLSPALNLLDGTESPKYSDISYSFTVSGLVNKSGNDYDGRSIPAFAKTVKFEPLFSGEIDDFSTVAKDIKTFAIPLAGVATEVGSEVTVEGTIPDGVVFTASLSEDGTSIVLTSSESLTNEEFTADFTVSGIRVAGGKESYARTFEGLNFVPKIVTLDGKMDEEAWKSSGVVSSEDSYSDSNTYQNIKKVSVTNDGINLYVAVEFDEALIGNKHFVQLSFDPPATTNSTTDSTDWGDNTGMGARLATSSTFSNDGLDVKAYELISWGKDSELDGHHLASSNLKSSATYPEYSDDGDGYQCDSKIIEYAVRLSDLGVSSGEKVKLFVSIAQYSWNDSENADHEKLLDCVPSAAATVSDDGETVAVDFSKALEYTVK